MDVGRASSYSVGHCKEGTCVYKTGSGSHITHLLPMQPLHLVKVTKGKLGSDETSPKTLSRRCQEMEHVHNLVSGGCSVKLLVEEVRVLTSEE